MTSPDLPDVPPGGSTGQPIGLDGRRLGIYDGVCIWLAPDGSMTNRFRGEGSRRERLTDDWIMRLQTGAPDSSDSEGRA